MCTRDWREEGDELLFSEWRVSMWEDENAWGWILGWLHKNMIVLNATGWHN